MKKIAARFAVVLVGATLFTGLAATTPAAARTHVSIAIGGGYGPAYRGYGPRYGYGPGYGYGYGPAYGYGPRYGYGPGWGRPYGWRGPVRYQPACWTDWRWDPYYGERVPVRVCR